MAQTFNTILSFVKSTSRKDRRKGVGSLSVSAVAGGGVGSAADSATQAWVRDNFVDKTTEQEISALKIFSQGIKIGDVSLFKHPDGYVYLDETLVLKGGVVMYGNGSGAEVPSIFDSLPIDGRTIKRDGNGVLYVDETALSISGGGGGVADSVYWNNVIGKPSWIGSTKPTYKYSEIEERPDLSVYAKLTDIPSLNGYATQSWVEGKGYLLATTASDTYQPKITSSNKLAYSLISGTPDLSVYAKKNDIPSLSDYATQSWVSNNYLSKSGGRVLANAYISWNSGTDGNDVSDWNTITENGLRIISSTSASSNAPTQYSTGLHVKGRYGFQIASQGGETTTFYIRNIDTRSNSWQTLIHSGNIGSQSVASATNADNLAGLGSNGYYHSYRFITNTDDLAKLSIGSYGISDDNGGTNPAPIPYSSLSVFGDIYYSAQLCVANNASSAYLRGITKGTTVTASEWHQIAFTDSNVASATKLATARTIWGQSFDGTGNITGDIAFWADEKISWHNSPKYYYISSPATADAARLEYNSYGGHAFLGGNVAIGGTTADATLHVHGVAQASLFKSAKGYTLTSSETAYCGLMPNNVITTMGNATDFWLYNTTDIKYYATKHIFLGDNVAIGDTTADAKLHVHGTAKFTGDTTFSSKVVIGTIPVYQSADGTLFVDANIVFRGGVAMHGNTTTTINEE